MCIEERIDSQHMPISSVLKCVHGVVLNHDFKPFSFERLIWMPENLSVFKKKLKEGNSVKHLDAAKRAIPLNINQAVGMNKKVNVTKLYPRQT